MQHQASRFNGFRFIIYLLTQEASKMLNTTNHPAAALFSKRHKDLLHALQSANLRALALNPGASLTYLTGLHFHLSERPVVAVICPDNPVHIILPELEGAKLLDIS